MCVLKVCLENLANVKRFVMINKGATRYMDVLHVLQINRGPNVSLINMYFNYPRLICCPARGYLNYRLSMTYGGVH